MLCKPVNLLLGAVARLTSGFKYIPCNEVLPDSSVTALDVFMVGGINNIRFGDVGQNGYRGKQGAFGVDVGHNV